MKNEGYWESAKDFCHIRKNTYSMKGDKLLNLYFDIPSSLYEL